MPATELRKSEDGMMSIEGFNLLRKRINGKLGPYQLIIDDINLCDLQAACRQLDIISNLLTEGSDQLDRAVILMPPGMHLSRVK